MSGSHETTEATTLITTAFDSFLANYSQHTGDKVKHMMSGRLKSKDLAHKIRTTASKKQLCWTLNSQITRCLQKYAITMEAVEKDPTKRNEVFARGGYGNIYLEGETVRKEYHEIKSPREVYSAIKEFVLFHLLHGNAFEGNYELNVEFNKGLHVSFTIPRIKGSDYAEFIRTNSTAEKNLEKIHATFAMLAAVAKSLYKLQKAGFLYRDLKGENIYGREDSWFLIDFGIIEEDSGKMQFSAFKLYMKRVLSTEHMKTFCGSDLYLSTKNFHDLITLLDASVNACNIISAEKRSLGDFHTVLSSVEMRPETPELSRDELPIATIDYSQSTHPKAQTSCFGSYIMSSLERLFSHS